MESTGSIKEEAPPPLPLGIFEIPGEPVVVINGVPDELQTECMIAKDEPKSSSATVGYGEWLEGREVQIFFLGQYYSGTVTKFDKDIGWYMVEYEDGDSEELDLSELEEVLLPLDVTIPLRSISLGIIKKRQTPGPSLWMHAKTLDQELQHNWVWLIVQSEYGEAGREKVTTPL